MWCKILDVLCLKFRESIGERKPVMDLEYKLKHPRDIISSTQFESARVAGAIDSSAVAD